MGLIHFKFNNVFHNILTDRSWESELEVEDDEDGDTTEFPRLTRLGGLKFEDVQRM